MRPSNKQRSRNKSGNNPQRRGMGNIVNRVFESAGPDGKVRGTPQQIIDKYLVLARDAQVSGDRVTAESYLQHAEHYTRLLGEAQRQTQENRQSQENRQDDRGDAREDRDEAMVGEATVAERQQTPAGDQQQAAQPQPSDSSGLATFGDDEPAEQGPVETPEAARQPAAPDQKPQQEHIAKAEEGERTEEEAAAAPAEEPAPKRPRTRRKKPAAQVAEASAE